jgi:hypothetical protein
MAGNGEMLHDGHASGNQPRGGNGTDNGAMASAGASSAERQRGRRLDVRIPAHWETGDTGEVEDAPQKRQDEPQNHPTPDYTTWDGRDAVRDAYERLNANERKSSIRKLAPTLAERTNLSPGTVRVYLGEIRQAQRASSPQAAVATPTT